MEKYRSFFFPMALIATGVIWLLVSMNVIPAANVWALTHIWPYLLIALGVGIIIRGQWPSLGWVFSALIVIGALLAVIYAPRLGWDNAPSMDFESELGGGVAGSGKIEAETRDVKDFLAVSIRYPAEVIIQQGTSESVKVEADDNLLAQLGTEMRNGTLYIENKESDWSKRVNPTKPVKITVTVKDLHDVSFSSAGRLRIENLKTDDLNLSLSGAGDINLVKVNIRNLETSLSGAGSIKADGVADKIKISISGLGNFEAPELTSMTADVHISGAGKATLRVKNDLTASVSGAGSIGYYGSPHVTKHISGAGSVEQIGK